MHSTTLERPAGHAIHRLASALERRATARHRRRRFKRLLDLDDHMLEDIGVARHEVASAARLPLSMDAATELRRVSLERRKRRM